jgi:hypothetical protein
MARLHRIALSIASGAFLTVLAERAATFAWGVHCACGLGNPLAALEAGLIGGLVFGLIWTPNPFASHD